MRGFLERFRFPLLLSLFLLVTTAYILWGGEETGIEEESPELPAPSPSPAVFTVKSDSNLIYQVDYSKCGHTEVLRERTPSDEIGLTLEDLETIYQDWLVEQTGNDVVLTARVEGLCELCRDNVFVSVYEGRVAVFYGEPGGDSWLKEVTEIPVGNLPPREKADLEAGIPVSGDDELLQILEGLMN